MWAITSEKVMVSGDWFIFSNKVMRNDFGAKIGVLFTAGAQRAQSFFECAVVSRSFQFSDH
jgi:hypothetical protein